MFEEKKKPCDGFAGTKNAVLVAYPCRVTTLSDFFAETKIAVLLHRNSPFWEIIP
jgi:hypothetical protein